MLGSELRDLLIKSSPKEKKTVQRGIKRKNYSKSRDNGEIDVDPRSIRTGECATTKNKTLQAATLKSTK